MFYYYVFGGVIYLSYFATFYSFFSSLCYYSYLFYYSYTLSSLNVYASLLFSIPSDNLEESSILTDSLPSSIYIASIFKLPYFLLGWIYTLDGCIYITFNTTYFFTCICYFDFFLVDIGMCSTAKFFNAIFFVLLLDSSIFDFFIDKLWLEAEFCNCCFSIDDLFE